MLDLVCRDTFPPSVDPTHRSPSARNATIRPFREMQQPAAGYGLARVRTRRWMSSQSMSVDAAPAEMPGPVEDGFCRSMMWTFIPPRRWLRKASLPPAQLTSKFVVAYRVTFTPGFDPSIGMT